MGRKLRIDAPAYIWLSLGILLLPLNWLAAAVTAAAVHEICHLLAAKLLGVRTFGMTIGTGGCLLETEPMDGWKELICAAAGPLGSLSLLFLARRFPRLAICGGIQGLYNLLPLYPLDGGRILRSGAGMLWGEEKALLVSRWTERIFAAVLLVAAVFVSLRANWGILSASVGVFLAARIGNAKNSLQTGATRGTIELPFLKR